MADYNVTFKVQGTFSIRVKAVKPESARAQALSAFFAAVNRASREGARLLLDPEPNVVSSAVAVEASMAAAGIPRIDWRGAHELLAITLGEFAKQPEEREALAIVQAALNIASAYPEDQNFQSELVKCRAGLTLQKLA